MRARSAAGPLATGGVPGALAAGGDDDEDGFAADATGAIRQHFDEQGYAVVQALLPAALCAGVRAAFAAEVKPYEGPLYRQTSAHAERHRFGEHGFVLNPLLNVQSLDQRRFPRFRAAGLELLTHPRLHAVAAAILGAPGTVVQSMYFEGNAATWAHQDVYYLDAAPPGRMTGLWIALEDIAAGAGRFYVYPGSHRIALGQNRGELDFAFHHERYKQRVREAIAAAGLVCRAPALRQGDVLFFASRTIHGSHPTTAPQHARNSMTAHLITTGAGLLQFQRRTKPLATVRIHGVPVHLPKDQNAWAPRAMLWLESTFPRTLRLAKKVAIKALLR